MTRRLLVVANSLRSDSGKGPAPRSFVVYVALVAAAAVGSLILLPWMREWRVGDPALFVVLSVFVLAGELLPIPVPRRRGLDSGDDLGRVRVRDPAPLRRWAGRRWSTSRVR